MSKIDSVKIRMYRHGFGDCFLIRFFDGDSVAFKMLIDCGLKHNDSVDGVSIADVVEDIKENVAVKKGRKMVPHLDVLAVTHEHWDHVSGFKPEKKLFDKFDIDNVWMAWTENPEDEVAQQINAHLQENLAALTLAAKMMSENTARKKAAGLHLSEYMGDTMLGMREHFNKALDSVLEFYGPLGATEVTESGIKIKDNFKISIQTQKAFEHIKAKLAKEHTALKYFEPGMIIKDKKLPGVRIYVMGPPKNEKINKSSPSKGAAKEVYLGLNNAGMAGFVKGVLNIGGDGSTVGDGNPFSGVKSTNVEDAKAAQAYSSYFRDDQSWRSIDDDWLNMAGALALQMDSDTNNTSLVLAIELMDSGKILLFPGDAQVGSWLSWHDHTWNVGSKTRPEKITAADILKNTVFYKAGHHASHNATVKDLGLELMEHEELVVFIPEKEDQYNGIPYDKLVNRLKKKAKGRVLFSADSNYRPEDTLDKKPANISQAEWDNFVGNIELTNTYIEYTVR